MENNVGDVLHCEEQLRTTLQYDDKEKLRRKLVQLQREYLRTAQRLKRAERSEAVQRHVRSRITQQNQEDQRNAEITSNSCLNPASLTLNTTTTNGTSACQGNTGDPAGSENPRRSQVIRFLLPSDDVYQQTPDYSHDAARGHRPSPALRLRSRRSRLRWERRSTEAGRSTDNSEEGAEQSERMEAARTGGSEEGVNTDNVVNESEEIISATESESPSLLLTHWNNCGLTERGNVKGKETQGGQNQSEKETELTLEQKKESESVSLLLTCCDLSIDAGQDGALKEGREDGEKRGLGGGRLCEDDSYKDTEQNTAEEIQSERVHDNTAEKSEMVEGENDVKGVSLLDSCTLVEGLLFPAEYYVRTTRRMTSSQSQPHMEAVIHSHLNMGRQRRRQGRGRGLNSRTHSKKGSDQQSQTDFSLTTASPSVGYRMGSQATDTSELNSQSFIEVSDQMSACHIDTDPVYSPMVTTARSARGRRRRRGRGRGRLLTPQCSLSLDSHQPGSDSPQASSTPDSSSLSLHGADGPCLTPGKTLSVIEDLQSVSMHSAATQPSSGGSEAQSNSASVYPMFLKSRAKTPRPTQMRRSTTSWRSLLLPSSPAAQTSLLPLPSPSPSSLINGLMNFEIPQDFHLPDDQFASLKLHKLREVTLESGVEHFASPSYGTRRSIRRSETCSESAICLPLPLSLTPTISNSPNPSGAKQTPAQHVDLQILSMDHKLEDKLESRSLVEESSDDQETEKLNPECQTHTISESVSVVKDCAPESVNQYKEPDWILNTHSQSSISPNNTHRSNDGSIKPHPHIILTDRPAGTGDDQSYIISQSDELETKGSSMISLKELTDCPGVVRSLEDQRSTNQQTEGKAVIRTLSFDCPLQKTPEEPSNTCTAVEACNDSDAPAESPEQHLDVKSPAEESNESSKATTSPPRETRNEDKRSLHHSVHSQLLLSPPPASATFITPHLRSSALLYSPILPSLGLTPHSGSATLPLTSSPSAPPLTLPPPHSPSTQNLSPPALSPCPSPISIPPNQPPASPAGQIHPQSQRVEPASVLTASSTESQVSGGQVGLATVVTAEEHMTKSTHTLKAPAGGSLVDACCFPGPSGGLCVVAAGKWAVCLWSQTPASDWSLTHTWAFNEPVINVFPVLDAAGLMCVTLGQLEIREVRMLSFSSLLNVLLCEGLVQTVVGVPRSRVVVSSHSASGSTLHVFLLSDSDSTPSSQPLVSPGVCVGALAPVDGLSDALIGTDEGGCLFVWNLNTGQLLQRITLGDNLSHTACLSGYSHCGVLFVLLQHQLLSSLEEEERQATAKDPMCLEEETAEEEKRITLFSLVAVNPLSGKSVQASRLCPPKAWSGRLCEADVNGCSVVGLSQTGCVCVWELGLLGASRMVWAPESEGWQLARWGAGGMLVTGHHNGDVTLH